MNKELWNDPEFREAATEFVNELIRKKAAERNNLFPPERIAEMVNDIIKTDLDRLNRYRTKVDNVAESSGASVSRVDNLDGDSLVPARQDSDEDNSERL
ncbi:MAG: acyl-CoA dehydrogenase family protein [Chloroflexi bacterium]|nr:acyl-CoA dehydrogenase family protein [Chloroflexota bacterium]